MEYNKYTVKLTDKTQFDITPEQYEQLIAQSTTGKDGVILSGDYVTFKSIYGIVGGYDKPVQQVQALPPISKSKHTEEWLEATRRNKKRIEDGIRPFANWRVTTEGKIIEDPEYYKNNVTVLSDYR